MFALLRACIHDVFTTQRFYFPRAGDRRRVTLLSLATAVLGSSVMFGCATLGGSGSSKLPPVGFGCTSAQQCRVQVSVDCSQTPCRLTIPDAQQIVEAKGFDVVWEIVPATGPYLFKHQDGIFFKTPEGKNAFSCHPEANDARFSCHGDKNRNAYEYGIELVGPQPVTVLDPWIVNN